MRPQQISTALTTCELPFEVLNVSEDERKLGGSEMLHQLVLVGLAIMACLALNWLMA